MRFYEFFIKKVNEYYTKSPKIGRGDFFTSPELDEAFGKSIAYFLKDYLDAFDNPKILELGAGNGFLAKDILSVLDVPYVILEQSDYLINIQKELLKDKDICWVKNLKDIEPFEGVIVSNEFFDALGIAPVKDKKELYIEQHQKEVWKDIKEDTKEVMGILGIDGHLYDEIPVDAYYLYGDVSRLLKKGYIFSIDYGYKTHPHKNTIRAIKDSKIIENIYSLEVFDISAMVDFSKLQKIGEHFGFRVEFLKSQRDFLIQIPYFVEVFQSVCQEEDSYSIQRCSRMKNLILSMGESFFVLFQSKA